MPTWIRVRDRSTGHEFDIEQMALDGATGVEPVAGYPPNTGPGARPRRAKHHVSKDGRPAAPKPRRQQPPAMPADTEGATT